MNMESCVMTEWCDEMILVSFLLKNFFLFNIKTVTTEHINIVFKKKTKKNPHIVELFD